jgi:thiol-disulfide isomerase/thioredoxin
MPLRLAVVGGLLALVGIGVLWSRPGDEAEAYRPPVSRLHEDLLPETARGRLAVLAFRSRFCLACRRTPDVVAEALEASDADAAFVHVDVADHPALVDELDLGATPTVLLVDAEGRLRYASQGNPSPGELAAYLGEAAASPGGAPGLLSAVEDAVRG